MLNALKRDILFDMDKGDDDAFFVSFDFKVAFDRVNHKFLFFILEKLGFSKGFFNMIKALYYNAPSVIIINCHKTRKIKIKSGSRQGCTMSRDLYTLSSNPLLRFLNLCDQIQKYTTYCGLEILTACFTDDMNLFTPSLSSLITCLF